MSLRLAYSIALAVTLVGCGRVGVGRESWPDPPDVDQSTYQQEYEAWRAERQESAADALRILGIWPLEEGETPFGADASLPIVLPPSAAPRRAGVFRRAAEKVTVIPASGAPLRLADGSQIKGPHEVATFETELALGSVRLQVVAMGEGASERLFVSASDEDHPAVRNLTMETYPLDPRWRVAARFEAFEAPRPVRVPDVRGGFMDFVAPGQLVFRLNDKELRLTAMYAGDDQFFVMFKDSTNGSTTFGGYRMLAPPIAKSGEWTVLDFNLAMNPPCAYSSFTTCPLPPPENRLQVAVEAGQKRHPSAPGFVQ